MSGVVKLFLIIYNILFIVLVVLQNPLGKSLIDLVDSVIPLSYQININSYPLDSDLPSDVDSIIRGSKWLMGEVAR